MPQFPLDASASSPAPNISCNLLCERTTYLYRLSLTQEDFYGIILYKIVYLYWPSFLRLKISVKTAKYFKIFPWSSGHHYKRFTFRQLWVLLVGAILVPRIALFLRVLKFTISSHDQYLSILFSYILCNFTRCVIVLRFVKALYSIYLNIQVLLHL